MHLYSVDGNTRFRTLVQGAAPVLGTEKTNIGAMTTYSVACSLCQKKALVKDEGFHRRSLRYRGSFTDHHPLASGVHDGDGGIDRQIDEELAEQIAGYDRSGIGGKGARWR